LQYWNANQKSENPMAQLTIRLLGAPTIARDAAPITMDTRKATALLAYLAVTGRSHGR